MNVTDSILPTQTAVADVNNNSLPSQSSAQATMSEEAAVPEEILQTVISMIQEMLGLFGSESGDEQSTSGFSLSMPALPSFSDSNSSGQSSFQDVAPLPSFATSSNSEESASSGSTLLQGGLPDLPSLTGSSSSLPTLEGIPEASSSLASGNGVFNASSIPNLTGGSSESVAPAQDSMFTRLPSLPSLMGNSTSLPSLTADSASSSSSGVLDATGIPSLTGSSSELPQVSSSSSAQTASTLSNGLTIPSLLGSNDSAGTSSQGVTSGVPSLGVSSSGFASSSSSSGVPSFGLTNTGFSSSSSSTSVPNLLGSSDTGSTGAAALSTSVPSLAGDDGLRALTENGFSVEDLDDALDDLTRFSTVGGDSSSHWKA